MDKFTIENMNLYYGKFHALKNVNIRMKKNRITAFIGPSGCGKSTLLKSLNRMNDLVEGCKITGDIRLDNEDIYGDMDVNILRKRVGMVFQKANPFPMSIYDNIAFGPRTHGIKSKKELDRIVEESLRDAAIWDELKDRLKKSALGLSGGQQQRLCIARALAVKPEVLLMDEATSALDPISTGKIEELCLKLKNDYTIVMVTHNMQQALRISDETAFFLLGEMVECNSTDAIFSNPQDKRTEDYGKVWLMREYFDKELTQLNDSLIEMGGLVEQAIKNTMKMIVDGEDLLDIAREHENRINEAEKSIQSRCLHLLLHQAPVAHDLRYVSAALKMITDLERIGDQAVDIAEMSVYIKDKKQVFNLTHILEMADNASKMVTEAIDAFVKSDIEVAKKVARQDDIVDELFNRSKNETVELIHKNKELGSEALDIVMIAKYLERIADHAVNVAEWVAFSITGSCDLSD